MGELLQMINKNRVRFANQQVIDEWERIYAQNLIRQQTQCDFCREQRDIEQKNGQRIKATPQENISRRKAHDTAMAELEEHWASGQCKDRKEMGTGWIFDEYKPFNPDDPALVQV